eukprot:CAMPEP_0119493006 /NCGR_PEP_ID=MMETSP1344-20130328/17385_1 /TAXON_ID=236787 /ORGANISM="Florenciella parvula, Strain CCMP2471" /LENGTH=72 /DNA_ID=CAMNT_0007528395 /DNA_START=72 /DNA_END=290 /DNA_ORIENTATION=+
MPQWLLLKSTAPPGSDRTEARAEAHPTWQCEHQGDGRAAGMAAGECHVALQWLLGWRLLRLMCLARFLSINV